MSEAVVAAAAHTFQLWHISRTVLDAIQEMQVNAQYVEHHLVQGSQELPEPLRQALEDQISKLEALINETKDTLDDLESWRDDVDTAITQIGTADTKKLQEIAKVYRRRKGSQYVRILAAANASTDTPADAQDNEDSSGSADGDALTVLVDSEQEARFVKYANLLEPFRPFQRHTKVGEMNARISYAAIEYSKTLRENLHLYEEDIRVQVQLEEEQRSEKQRLLDDRPTTSTSNSKNGSNNSRACVLQ